MNKSLKDVVNLVEEEIKKELEEELKKNVAAMDMGIEVEEEEEVEEEQPPISWSATGGGLSKSLTKASNVGTKMIPKVVFPAAPKLFRDGWVLTELLLTLVQFVYAFISTDFRVNRLFNGIYVILSVVNLVLSLIDGFYYFYELGSCMVAIRRCKRRFRKRKRKRKNSNKDYEALEEGEKEGSDKEPEVESDDDSESDLDDDAMMTEGGDSESSWRCMKAIRLSPKRKEQLNMWMEMIRNVISELLIYPLVVLDLFGVISDPEITDRLNFSFFVIGSFYLVLSVYISRTMSMILTMLTLRGLLSNSDSGKNNIVFIVRFLLHSVAQIVVHISCVLAVAIKIVQENANNNGHYHASPILWVVILGGWCVPFLGTLTFFLVNYFWAQQFSIGFFVELMALLQEGDVVETVVQGKEQTKAEADERSKQILEKMQFSKVKDEYATIEKTSALSKLSYPIKIPLYILLCIVYNVALGGFFACLMLTWREDHIAVISFDDYKGIGLAIISLVIFLANIHLIIVSNITIIVFLSVFSIVFFLPGFFSVPLFLLLMYVVRRGTVLPKKKSKSGSREGSERRSSVSTDCEISTISESPSASDGEGASPDKPQPAPGKGTVTMTLAPPPPTDY